MSKKIFIWIIGGVSLTLCWPVRAAGLVPCIGSECRLCDLLVLIVNLTSFMMKNIAAPLAGLMFLIGGIMMISSGGEQKRYASGKQIFINTLIGAALVLSAWAIVNTIITVFGSAQVIGTWWQVQCR